MLMNGKEVNHLVIGGETFDKNVFGIKCNVTKYIWGSASLDAIGNVISSDIPAGYLVFFDPIHGPYIVCAETKKAYYLTTSGLGSPDRGGWVDKKYVVLVD